MNTKRRLCLTLVALMLCVALVFGVAACDDTTEEIPSAETDDGLFTNGTLAPRREALIRLRLPT